MGYRCLVNFCYEAEALDGFLSCVDAVETESPVSNCAALCLSHQGVSSAPSSMSAVDVDRRSLHYH